MAQSKTVEVGSFITNELIERKIYLIRGQKVMLDRDLATLYDAETRTLNQAVRRNMDRFPADFMFPLSRNEIRDLSQTVISLKHAPNVFVFTELGVAMLSSVLNSPNAIHVNIQIMRTFVKLRQLLSTHKDLEIKIADLERKYDSQFRAVFDAIREILKTPKVPKKKPIGFHAKY